METGESFKSFHSWCCADIATDAHNLNFNTLANTVKMNDPVMGGKSTGTFSIENRMGVFKGEVVDVPFLQAPGFIKTQTTDRHVFPDVSSCQALQLLIKSNEPYLGYRVSFGNKHAPGGKLFANGYKANMENVPTDDFDTVTIPFDYFTDFWDDATGEPIHTCHENKKFCPDQMTLQNMRTLAVWAEGVAGKVSLEIKSISAVGCAE
jgi:hypothetical protein